MNNIITNLDDVRGTRQVTKQFLALLADDIDSGNVKSIPNAVVERVTAIKHKAQVAKQSLKSATDLC